MELHQKTSGPLIIFLTAVLFAGISWSALIPMWQTPDEQAHFAQAQDFAALGVVQKQVFQHLRTLFCQKNTWEFLGMSVGIIILHTIQNIKY